MSNEEQLGIDLGVEGKVNNQGDETNAITQKISLLLFMN